jgi:hypothetical protein
MRSGSIPASKSVNAQNRAWFAILLGLLAVAFCGCGRTAEDQLIGRWEGSLSIDQQEVERQLKAQKTPFAGQMGRFLIDGLKSMQTSVEFRGDGTMSMNVAAGPLNRSSEGTWEVISEDDDNVTLRSIDDKGNEQQFRLRFDGYDAFEMKAQGDNPTAKMGTLRFERVIEQ